MFLILACTGPEPADTGPCVSWRAVVTDIDETLTTNDEEWLSQMSDASHDPAMRPEADALMRGYDELGYGVFYVTARGDEFTLSDGRSAFEGTRDWLVAHGFPVHEERIFLSEGFGVLGEDAEAYKIEVLEGLGAEGWGFDWAYGNADSDIAAFQGAGIPDDRIFLVGELAGQLGVQPILDEEAYAAHLEAQLPSVEPTECAD